MILSQAHLNTDEVPPPPFSYRMYRFAVITSLLFVTFAHFEKILIIIKKSGRYQMASGYCSGDKRRAGGDAGTSGFVLQSNWNEITDNFDDMNLKETLLRGIYAYGFEKPSAIQQRAIIPCIKGDYS